MSYDPDGVNLQKLNELLSKSDDSFFTWDGWPQENVGYCEFRPSRGIVEITLFFQVPLNGPVKCRADVDIYPEELDTLTKAGLDGKFYQAIGETIAYIIENGLHLGNK